MSALGIRTIIVATDLSAELIPAVQTAARLAQLTDAELHIVHTTESQVPESRLADYLRAANVDTGSRSEAHILLGPPGALIVQEAFRLQADVIVFGPHHPGRSQLGSTTHHVLLTTHTPCLMLPVRLALPLRRVLVPVDLSARTDSTLQTAFTWTSALRSRHEGGEPTELIALHVAADETAAAAAADRLASVVDHVRQPFGDAAGVAVNTRMVAGAPSPAILNVADADGVDLIVMGTRGTDPQKDPLGSVSRDIVTRARHPVLLVPPGPA